MGAMQQSLIATAGTSTPVPLMPTFVSSGSWLQSVNAITLTPPVSYADGDLLVILVNSANQTIATPSTGGTWTQVSNSPQGTGTAGNAGAVAIAAFYKVASGVQSDVTIADSGNYTTAQMFAFRRVNSTPIDVTAGSVKSSATGTTFTLPSVTTTVDNDLILLCVGMDRDIDSTTNLSGYTNTNLSNITEITDQTTLSNTGGGIALAIGGKAAAGSTGTTTATSAAATTAAFITIGLKSTTAYFDTTKVLPPNGAIDVLEYNSGIATSSLTLNSDGSLTASVSTSLTELSWLNNVSSGNGSSYWIRATQLFNLGPGSATGTLSTWLQMNTARTWTVENSSTDSGAHAWSLIFDISTDSSGTTIVGTGALTLQAESVSGSPP